MNLSRLLDPKIIVTLGIGYLSGVVLMLLIPEILNRGVLGLVFLPVLAIFFLLMIVRPHIAVLLILLTRAGIDPLIEMSRSGDMQMGLGAGINLIVILLTIFVWLRFQPTLPKNGFLLFWVLFLLVAFCAIFYAPYPFRALRLFLNFVTYAAMAVLPFILVTRPGHKYFWLKWLLVASIVPVAVGNFQFIASDGSAERIIGTFQHANIFAFFLVQMIVVAVVLVNSPHSGLSKGWKNFLKLYLLNLFVMLLFTKTRNAWIVCWIIFFIYGLLVNRKVLLVTLIASVLALFLPSIQARILDLFQGNDISSVDKLNSFAWRRKLWIESIPWIAKRPIEGYGLTSFVPLSREFSDFASNMKGVGAHNTYLETMFEMGILGLSAFVGIWVSLFRFFTKQIKALSGYLRGEYVLALAYVISYAVVCIADNMSYYLVSNWYAWFFIGLMVACAVKFPAQETCAK